MKNRYFVAILGLTVLAVVCYWLTSDESTTYKRRKRYETTMHLRKYSKGSEKAKEAIEAAFQELMALDSNEGHTQVAGSVAKLAWQAPEIIVEKLLDPDWEISYRALKVIYAFNQKSAETSGLVRLLVGVYHHLDQSMQKTILIALGHLKAKSALPLLREVLDDTRPDPPPPPHVEPAFPPIRICDTAYNQILSILENMKVQHGLKRFSDCSTYKDILKMKQWLDSHPEVMKAATSTTDKNKNK